MAHTAPITIHIADLPEIKAALQQLADARNWVDQHRENDTTIEKLAEILGMRTWNPGQPVETSGRPAPVNQPAREMNEWIAEQQVPESRIDDRRCRHCGQSLASVNGSCEWHGLAAVAYAADLLAEYRRTIARLDELKLSAAKGPQVGTIAQRVVALYERRIASLAAGDFASASRDFGRGVAYAVLVMRGVLDVDGQYPPESVADQIPAEPLDIPAMFPADPDLMASPEGDRKGLDELKKAAADRRRSLGGESMADQIRRADRIRGASNG